MERNPAPYGNFIMSIYRAKNIAVYREQERIRSQRIRATRRKIIADAKTDKGCVQCGEKHPSCLQFHHLDALKKEFTIARAVSEGKSIKKIHEEIEKCILLCANCHAKEHWRDGDELNC